MALHGPQEQLTQEDFWGKTQLARLSFMGQDVEAARKLIKDEPHSVNQRGSAYNETPLLTALSGGRASNAFLDLLINNGAEVTATYAGGKNILHCASNAGNVGHVMYALKLDKCPDINSKTDNGNTPLHAVCMQGVSTATLESRKAIVKELISRGADIEAKNNANRTPAEEAKAQGLVELSNMINKMKRSEEIYKEEKQVAYTVLQRMYDDHQRDLRSKNDNESVDDVAEDIPKMKLV